MPVDTPQAENPPDGALIDYYLKSAPAGVVTLEVLDSAGKLVRRYSSDEKAPQIDPKQLDFPVSSIHLPQPLSAEPGMHRFVWDVRYEGEPGGNRLFALFLGSGGAWALPGQYKVKLTVNGKSYTQPLTVKMDPRVKTPMADLVKQFNLVQQVNAAQAQVSAAFGAANRLHGQLQGLKAKASENKTLADEIEALDKKAAAIAGGASGPSFFEMEASSTTNLRSLLMALSQVTRAAGSADVAPTPDAVTAFQRDQQAVQKTLGEWNLIKSKDVPHLNLSLKQARLPPISVDEGKMSRAELEVIQALDEANDE